MYRRTNETKALKIPIICFSQLSQWPFQKLKKICYSDIVGQNWYSYNAKFTNPNFLVKNMYSIPLGNQLAKSIEKFWGANKWNY